MQRSARIIRLIESEILNGKMPVGQRLESEEKLCERFGVSRTVIREAIQQLRGRGLLRSIKGSGTFIAESNLDTLANAMEAYSVLAEDMDFLELIDFRILIESECARLAAIHAGEGSIRELRMVMDAMRQSKEDRDEFSRLDIAFHLAIARGSGNRIYATVLRALEKKCIDYARKNRGDSDWYQSIISSHQAILDAIVNGKADQASDAMHKHLLYSRRLFVDLTEGLSKERHRFR
jgi:GntR family transcriptional regulator, transcriptional repressor for pyruvate dehydrogenase complex